MPVRKSAAEAAIVALPWSLECSGCGATRNAAGLPGVCDCGQPYLVRYRSTPGPGVKARLPGRGWTMWRYREWLPLADQETPISLGEGGTPLLTVPRLAAKHGLRGLFVKEEGVNPTRSEEHTSELQSQSNLVCRLLLEKKKKDRTQAALQACNLVMLRRRLAHSV